MTRTHQPDSPDEIETAIQQLRNYHRLGSEIRDSLPAGRAYNERVVERQAEARGLSTGTIRKLRTLADPEQGYGQAELEELCCLFREHGCAPRISIVYKFLSVPKDRDQRAEFQQQVIEGHWKRPRVDQELRKLFGGRRRSGGKRKRIPDDPGNVLAQIEGMCFAWARFCTQLAEKDRGLSAKVKRRLKAASQALQFLGEAVESELSRTEIRT